MPTGTDVEQICREYDRFLISLGCRARTVQAPKPPLRRLSCDNSLNELVSSDGHLLRAFAAVTIFLMVRCSGRLFATSATAFKLAIG